MNLPFFKWWQSKVGAIVEAMVPVEISFIPKENGDDLRDLGSVTDKTADIVQRTGVAVNIQPNILMTCSFLLIPPEGYEIQFVIY